eukprot:tig00000204_g17706.t1
MGDEEQAQGGDGTDEQQGSRGRGSRENCSKSMPTTLSSACFDQRMTEKVYPAHIARAVAAVTRKILADKNYICINPEKTPVPILANATIGGKEVMVKNDIVFPYSNNQNGSMVPAWREKAMACCGELDGEKFHFAIQADRNLKCTNGRVTEHRGAEPALCPDMAGGGGGGGGGDDSGSGGGSDSGGGGEGDDSGGDQGVSSILDSYAFVVDEAADAAAGDLAIPDLDAPGAQPASLGDGYAEADGGVAAAFGALHLDHLL